MQYATSPYTKLAAILEENRTRDALVQPMWDSAVRVESTAKARDVMLGAMSDERVRNDVPGNVTGQVTQVGAVHGDMHVHAPPTAPTPEPLLDLGIRIACSLTDDRDWTLRKIVLLLADRDQRRAEQVIELIADAANAQRAGNELAAAIVERDPERAHQLAQAMANAPVSPWEWVIAIATMVTAGLNPGRCDQLVRQVEEEQPADAHIPLARLANAVHTNDPACAERLVALAERLALEAEHPDSRLWWIAHTVAATDPARAARTLSRLSPDYWIHTSFWSEKVADAARVHPQFALALIDTAAPALADSTHKHYNDYHLKDLAVAAAPVDPHRADRIAAMISSPRNQVAALTEMAEKKPDYVLARRWLATAEKAAGNSPRLLGVVATAALNLDPTLSRRARRRIVDGISPEACAQDLVERAKCLAPTDPVHALDLARGAGADTEDFEVQFAVKWVHVYAAKAFLANDPTAALRTMNDLTIPSGMEYGTMRFEAAKVLVKIARGLAVWEPEQAKGVANRAQRELRIASSGAGTEVRRVWRDLAELLTQVDPALCGRLAAQLVDFAQDEVLSVLTPVDPAAAERVAWSVIDRDRRESALTAVAMSACKPRY
ncbi:hypothetical protein ACWEGE_38390 [Amycolatopsis sp. NPDC004747]